VIKTVGVVTELPKRHDADDVKAQAGSV
jgi:hypothetical protein